MCQNIDNQIFYIYFPATLIDSLKILQFSPMFVCLLDLLMEPDS